MKAKIVFTIILFTIVLKGFGQTLPRVTMETALGKIIIEIDQTI